MSLVDLDQVDLSQVKNGELINIAPSMLLDMDGGNVRQNRPDFDNLVNSIKRQGIIQPVVARLMPDHTLQLLAGYGRRDGAIEAGLKTIPAIVRIVDDETSLEIHFRENHDRTELSFASQVEFAKRYMSFHNDAQSAALKLGWPLTMFRERLSLTTCTQDILNALDAGQITVKHALVFAAFEPKVQNNTLVKCVSEKWSVAEFKQRADQVKVPLSKAIFDTTECSTCLNNTAQQSGLFGMEDGAMCAKRSCYQAKTEARLADIKVQAEEKYGKVILLSQSLPSDRQTVAASVVGDQQFHSGCATCVDRVAVLDDSIVGNSGAILESQCTNKQCFSNCVNAFEASKLPIQPETENVNPVDDANIQSEKPAKAKTLKKAPAANDSNPAHVGAVSSVVTEKHQEEALIASRAYLAGNDKFKLVLHLIGIMNFTGFKPIASVSNTMATMMQLPEDQLHRMIATVEEFAITAAKDFRGTTPAHEALAATVVSCAGGKEALVKAWVPSENTLSSYTTAAVISLCVLAGFDQHVETKEAGAFKKMTSGKKGDVITAILAQSDFDWSHFAPPAYISLLDKLDKKPQAAAA